MFQTDDYFGEEHAHKEAVRKAVALLGEVWQGDYVGGMFHGDAVWVQINKATSHTAAVSLVSSLIDWAGGMP